jgi:NitT/TauT family transport system substrate-binding protein
MRKKSGPFISLLAVALVASACAEEGRPAGDAEQVASIDLAAIPPFSIPSWPMILAEHEGFFNREGVHVNITFTFDGGQLLAGGQVDVLSDGADSGLIAAARGKDILFVAPHMDTVTDGLMTSPDIDSVEDLPGKTLRVAGFGTDEFLARRFIEENGGDPDQIDFIAIEDDGAALAQIESGDIDGGMFGVGSLLEAEQTGDFKVLGPPEALGSYPWNVIQTTQAFADANGNALIGFIRAVQDGIRFMQDPANRDSVIEAVLASGEGVPREEVELSYDAANGFQQYSLDRLTPEDVEPAFDFFALVGEDIGPDDVELEQLIDNQYYDEASS